MSTDRDAIDAQLQSDPSFAAGFQAGMDYVMGPNHAKAVAAWAARETVLQIIGHYLDRRLRSTGRWGSWRQKMILAELRGYIETLKYEAPEP